MMSQLALAIDAHAPARRGSMDIAPMRKHALKVFNSMACYLNVSRGLTGNVEDFPKASFLFGGYSWVQKKFRLWSFVYEPKRKSFVGHPAQWIGHARSHNSIVLRRKKSSLSGTPLGPIVFAGDQAHIAQELLAQRLSQASKFPDALNMEPFEIICAMLRDPNHAQSIGGAPQLVKVYQYMKAATLGVYWPSKSAGAPTLRGRPCLPYERIDSWILDPDTLYSDQQGRDAETSNLDNI